MAGLPVHLTSFIGREAELAEALALARRSRLLTVVGPGGIGKTRLAIEVARRLQEGEIDAVFFVDLARLRDPNLIDQAVIAAMGGRQDSGRTPLETIIGLLSAPHSLLVIDNCEHIIEPVAGLVDVLLREIPGLCILITTREPLAVGAEAVWSVPALSDADGVQLFIERARAVNAGFATTDHSTAQLVELCRELDGLPLAIELAAARARQMPVGEILSRLGDRFALLTTRDRTTLARHQSLEAAIGWSYDLLQPREKQAFSSLSVIVGGFDLAAAEAVADCELDLLGRLVDKSIVIPGTGIGGRARYRLLETLREYAHERLMEAGREDEIRRRHFDHFRTLAGEAASKLRGPQQIFWLERLGEELPNIRAALEWGRTGNPNEALEMAVDLIWFWKIRGPWAEGRAWFKELASIAPTPQPKTLAAALTEAGDFASLIGDTTTAATEVDDALELWRRLDDPRGLARTLLSKAWIASRLGAGADQLLPLAEEAVHRAELSGDEHILAECISFRGYVKNEEGTPDEARADMEQAIAIDRRTGDLWTLALHLDMLGGLDYNLGRYELARLHYAEFMDLCRTVGDHLLLANAMTDMATVEMAQHEDAAARRDLEAALTIEGSSYPDAKALVGLAQLAARGGFFVRALKLHGAAWAMPWVRVRSRYRSLESQPWIGAARRALGIEAADAAWRAGAALTTPHAIAYALSDADESPVGGGPLTAREQQIASLVAQGLRNRDIAARLYISPRTVDAHVEHIRNKLGHQSRAQVAAWATEHGVAKT